MFTLKFTAVRFFNVSELGSRISSRTQISKEKKTRFWGGPFVLLLLLVCVTSILVGKKSEGFPSKSVGFNIHHGIFTREISWRFFEDLVIYQPNHLPTLDPPPVIVPINEVKIALNTVLQFIGRILLAVSAKCTNSNCFGPKSTGWEAKTQ